jgi:hypothetical protein
MLLSDGVPPPVLYVVISVLNMLSSCGFLNWSFLLQLMFCALVVCAGAHDLQFVIPVCLFQLVISEAGPTQGALLFLLLYYQQAPPGPAPQDSTTGALYCAPMHTRGSAADTHVERANCASHLESSFCFQCFFRQTNHACGTERGSPGWRWRCRLPCL